MTLYEVERVISRELRLDGHSRSQQLVKRREERDGAVVAGSAHPVVDGQDHRARPPNSVRDLGPGYGVERHECDTVTGFAPEAFENVGGSIGAAIQRCEVKRLAAKNDGGFAWKGLGVVCEKVEIRHRSHASVLPRKFDGNARGGAARRPWHPAGSSA